MEYQFTHSIHGVVAKCSMDHEAFAGWLNTEITENPKELINIFAEIEKCRAAYPNHYECVFEGKEYSLFLDCDEVMVKANNLDDTFDESQIEDGFQFYDQESIAFCGLEDFENFLKAYQKFSKTYH
ncbi:hypothetical protein CYK57_01139 [Actinobacillus pleuropneumoniae]|uniref:UPF0231 protein APL_0968 n=1 Tax=Actinobacillus pleuropneumoniae serotype 5b (strain L20) TaxID=416269 RepID=Y968_ACTP2|nr:YacL family protein [Actinobacillus pleuropneumoniae]A3N0X6.1 RecName: Full=UPF0231 protein APL_0968 [Actinobacillus pleuropneumoniae serovar 5b str. L20]ABN74062.1 hypothetical protein APL_0968 [Actinobacillus pleuropneumoniae serovar 5b str. L20]MEE3683865.1 YacL family protein [Actinobacillus pleuropneumoniae]QSZ39002.1 hypothetical protein CYK57_01139 [Actinobacillus pleuropneumoniae]UKH10816.1 YacL family protein [Actinobacillus pleuropneumoniae]UPK78822.1 YacL family protein [Actinob